MIKTFIIILIGVFAALMACVAMTIIVMPIGDMQRSAALLEQKTSELVHKAKGFDQKQALKLLGMNRNNNFYYRFDNHLENTAVDDHASSAFKPAPAAGFGFSFDENDSARLVFNKASHTAVNGICAIKSSPGAFITNAQELSLHRESLSEIEIRLKTSHGEPMLLGMSSNPDAQWSERDKTAHRIVIKGCELQQKDILTIPFAVIPDNTFHTYTIHVEKKLTEVWVAFDDKIRKFFISLPQMPDNEIQIDYIRFVTKREKLSSKPYGETYVTKQGQMRTVLFMNTPCRLRYTIAIPQATHSYLSFGTGILEAHAPVDFMVSLASGDVEKGLHRETVTDQNAWIDTKLDLADYAGRTVEILFSALSPTGNVAFYSNPVLYTLPHKKLNVVILLEDAQRPDHMSCYGYAVRETTPFKSKFIQKGVIFNYAFSQATETRPSCPSFMTSLFPTAAGASRDERTLHENYLTLAEIMRSQGYATASFLQNDNAGFDNGLHQGFSRSYNLRGMDRPADIYGQKLLDWLDVHQDRNFFLYLHIIDPHAPYNPPAPFDSWYREANITGAPLTKDTVFDPAWVQTPTTEGRRMLYDGSIRNNDYWFEKFCGVLASRGLLENTLLILISDHGEHLGERDIWGHLPPGYIQGIHVPLIMVRPGKLPEGKIINTPVQLLDILPTVLDICGIDKNSLVLQGDSLLPLIDGAQPDFWENRICFSEEVINRDFGNGFDCRPFGSMIIGNWHILNSREFLPSALRARRTGAEAAFLKAFNYTDDAAESRFVNSFYFDPLSKYIAGRLLENFHAANRQICLAFTGEEKASIKIDPVVQERLRALGYVQ